jgi:hypothetical protein
VRHHAHSSDLVDPDCNARHLLKMGDSLRKRIAKSGRRRLVGRTEKAPPDLIELVKSAEIPKRHRKTLGDKVELNEAENARPRPARAGAGD